MSSSQPTDVPPFYGAVETTMNALRLIHAARQGVIPRITRRLNDAERRAMIKSGAVFVFSVEESGIKRWTDGLLWSPSRIVGNFLVYREINQRTNSRGSHKKLYPTDESAGALTSSEHGTFKPNGLIKKTITVTIDGSDLHLISYYTSADQHSGKLKRPTARTDIMALTMDPRLFRATNFRVPPKVEKGPDGIPRLVETEEPTDVVECKLEDESYSVSVSPTSWGSDSTGSAHGSPVENPFVSSGSVGILYPVSPHSSPASYPRSGHHSDHRWSIPIPALRPDAWSSHAVHSAHHYSAGRRESDPWSLTNARWQGQDAYSPTASSYGDRSRSRAANNPYPAPLQIPARRDVGGHQTNADTRGAQRLPWLLADNKDGASTARPPSQASFAPAPSATPSPNYSTQGYMRTVPTHSHSHSHSQSYSGSAWSSGSSSSGSLSAMASPQVPFSPPPQSLHSYGSSYAQSSGAMSSPEDYSNAGEYGDS
ncbi:Gti1/Pac2 family-domain-containing protein [Mycena pura]|uniref:Gti1/Pac2 family-domain-containing protein n=1 Tax=Mycena pura TaxID=153505 RepID=A0AAD6VR43_9AGAR|nr:Gti1/Pac2 family-domain-containing protein [Mycena pura]